MQFSESNLFYSVVAKNETVPENWTNFPHTFFVVFTAITLYYIVVLLNILKNFITSPFFRIFFVTGVFDILQCIGVIFLGVNGHVTLGPKWFFAAYFSSFASCFCLFTNLIGNGLMIINRFSATFIGYQKYWSKHRVNAYMWILFTLCFIASVPALFRHKIYEANGDSWKVVTTTRQATVVNSSKFLTLARTNNESLVVITIVHLVLDYWILQYELNDLFNMNIAWVTVFDDLIVFYSAFLTLTTCNAFSVMLTSKTFRSTLFETIYSPLTFRRSSPNHDNKVNPISVAISQN
ncbi:unnamed protein product [Caenorhabditis bovis]|uniref:Serpentine receptor class gamma n=1 Tax=Caenorhabditis bovis TaxID=2654633 RepID=A0A8S1EZC0_9PELO|nr:unnamed protein product [Caenorhabditis bovis]